MNKRLSWDEYFSNITKVTSERSPCHRLKVGCILVNDNRIISQGYNGYLPGCPHDSIIRNNHEQATVHAEQNAIADCVKKRYKLFKFNRIYYTFSLFNMC